jgi:hypothetical protein
MSIKMDMMRSTALQMYCLHYFKNYGFGVLLRFIKI